MDVVVPLPQKCHTRQPRLGEATSLVVEIHKPTIFNLDKSPSRGQCLLAI